MDNSCRLAPRYPLGLPIVPEAAILRYACGLAQDDNPLPFFADVYECHSIPLLLFRLLPVVVVT